jgi:hypothetical protein
MTKYVANAHGEWIEVTDDTVTLYVLDTDNPFHRERVTQYYGEDVSDWAALDLSKSITELGDAQEVTV